MPSFLKMRRLMKQLGLTYYWADQDGVRWEFFCPVHAPTVEQEKTQGAAWAGCFCDDFGDHWTPATFLAAYRKRPLSKDGPPASR